MVDETMYARQELIQGLKIPEIASVVGCGGTGFWTAVFLAMSGVKELILIDPDVLDASNLNRLPFKIDDVGKRKVAITRNFIANLRNDIRVEVHHGKIETADDCDVLRGEVFCCTDSLKSQQLLCAYCKKNKLNYQRIGYDGTILNVSKTFPLTFEELKEEQQGYTVTPSWVIPAVFAACAGVSSRLYSELCLMDDIGKIHIQNCSHICSKAMNKYREEGENNILDDIHGHIPESYGYCSDCERIDADNNDYGYCLDCERIDPNDSDYGYCIDCDKVDKDEVDEALEEGREMERESLFMQLKTGLIADGALKVNLAIYESEFSNAKQGWLETGKVEARRAVFNQLRTGIITDSVLKEFIDTEKIIIPKKGGTENGTRQT